MEISDITLLTLIMDDNRVKILDYVDAQYLFVSIFD